MLGSSLSFKKFVHFIVVCVLESSISVNAFMNFFICRSNCCFWGCDINPVATLIAKTKSSSYDCAKVEQYFSNILESVRHLKMSPNLYQEAHERLKYWYSETNYCDLYKLYYAINTEVTEEKYREAFKCIFSSILKATLPYHNHRKYLKLYESALLLFEHT